MATTAILFCAYSGIGFVVANITGGPITLLFTGELQVVG
jgi:hypothetical protein